MPVYTVDNTVYLYKVFDANGIEYDGVIKIDTDNNNLTHYLFDNGRVVVDRGGNLLTEETKVPGPIVMSRIGERYSKEELEEAIQNGAKFLDY